MSDTDVYRLMWRSTELHTGAQSDWMPCRSNTHIDGLYISLKSAQRSRAQQPYEHEYKIQKLERAYGAPMGDDPGLEWVDVDA